MSLNWDKLQKLQRDHTKPKFAQQEVARQLKKRPNDPYLLTWQVYIALRLGAEKVVEDTLNQIWGRGSPITDFKLLSYIYSLEVERLFRYGETTQAPASAGTPTLTMWETASKAMPNSRERLSLWTVLLATATREGCWEDVRVALHHAQKEGAKSSKNVAFASIFATQMSYEMQKKIADQSSQPLSDQARIGRDLALARMKLVFQTAAKSPTNPVRVEDFKDLRFMANIYERQSKSAELFDLWDSAPDPVKSIIETNRYDIAHLKVNILQKTQQWSSLCELCIKIIEQALAECEEKQSLEPLEFLTENGVAVIVALVECAKNLTDADSVDAHNRIKDILSRFNSKANQSQGRSIEIARLLLMTADKQSLLEPCKTFWLRYGHLDACFSDLAPYCQHFDEEERRVFREYITSRWENDIANLSINGQDKKRDPLQTRLNALRFRFLLDLSTSEPPPIDVLNAYVVDALRLCKDAEQSGHRAFYEAGFLVIHSLASHANRELHETTTRVPFGRTAEQSRLEYQAAVLCQRLKDAKDGKDQRRLVLYSTRLHMLLGFATLGFELYRHARIKEMLTDTLSHHLLTRISHIHPFETKSIPTIDPNEELIGVIGKNEKMEVSMDGFLVPQNVKDYPYDSVVDMLGVKQALRSSLTKHLCIVERRRIARLKGEQIPEVLEQDLRTFVDITDQRDFITVPLPENVELRTGSREQYKSSPAGFPTVSSLYRYYRTQDTVDQIVSREKPHPTAQKRLAMLAEAAKRSGADDNQDHLSCEKLLDGLWDSLEKVAQSFHSADQALEDPVKLHQALKELLETLNSAQKTFQDISNARKPNTQAPNDSVLPRSDTLIYWYGTLEALQVCRKASVAAEAYFKPLTAKMIPAKAKNEAISVAKSIRDVSDRYYKDVRQNAQDWIDFLNRHGLGILKAWARWGATGEALKELLSDDDVAFYSQRALDSLTDSLGGILKVKMPK